MINAKFQRYLNRFIKVKQQKDPYLSVIQSKTDIMAQHAIIDGVITRTTASFAALSHTTAGVTNQKDANYSALIKLAHPLMRTLKGSATLLNDLATMARFDQTESKLLYMGQTQGRSLCQEAVNYATANLAALALFDVTPAQLTAITAKITAFDASKKPRVAKNEQTVLLQQIEIDLAKGNAAIDLLKDLNVRFKDANPAYYTSFVAATRIDSLPTASSGAVSGILRAESKRKRIANATITVFHKKDDGALSQIEVLSSNTSGEFTTSLQAGNYQFVVDAVGYNSLTAEKTIKNGNNKIDVSLDAAIA